MKHRRMSYNRATPIGVCRLCEKPILGPDGQPSKRLRWHPECVSTYRMTESEFARARVFERDKGVCSKCGGKECGADGVPRPKAQRLGSYQETDGSWYTAVRFIGVVPAWEHDHIIPLKDGGTFDLGNLQTLGPACHKAKTAIEAGQRAKVRRIVKKREGEKASLRGADGQVLA